MNPLKLCLAIRFLFFAGGTSSKIGEISSGKGDLLLVGVADQDVVLEERVVGVLPLLRGGPGDACQNVGRSLDRGPVAGCVLLGCPLRRPK